MSVALVVPSVRRLEPRHAARYRAFMLEAYAKHPESFTSSAAERAAMPLAWWEGRIGTGEASREAVFGALDGDEQLLGAAGLSTAPRERASHKATLFGMYVPQSVRGRGIGEQLVRAVLVHARARPALARVDLTVTQGNAAAERLYRRCGFVAWGVEPDAVRLGEAFLAKIHMSCDLRAARAHVAGAVTLSLHDELPAEAAIVDAGLGAFNDASAPLHEVRPLACLARDAGGEVVGGAVGRTWGACCELQQLWVHEGRRNGGIGAALVRAFEGRAAARGCSVFYLETFSFQAPGFYRRLGYAPRLVLRGFHGDIEKLVMVREGA